jgi:hypothetical protein
MDRQELALVFALWLAYCPLQDARRRGCEVLIAEPRRTSSNRTPAQDELAAFLAEDLMGGSDEGM